MKNELLAILEPHGQQHLLAFWDALDPASQHSLGEQIRRIDMALIDRLYRQRNMQDNVRELADRAGPPPAFRLDTSENRISPEAAREAGRRALAAGEVAVALVAGGQGTRLGFDHPKGMFPIGPVSERTLFQIHIEKLIARRRRHDAAIPLLLMTSPATHRETVEFFTAHDRFGLPKEDLTIFCQGTMPAVDEATGKILLAEKGRVAVSPDGHGGMLAALVESGSLEQMQRRSIRHLFYFQVDNPLVDVCWPEFLGYHLLAGSELSSQVIAKQEPLEKVGNVVQDTDGTLKVIEYSDLPNDVARRRKADRSLLIWAGSIAVHAMDVAFLARMSDTADALPFHIAHKKVPHVDGAGRRVEFEQPNAIKFERLIFDLLPSASDAIVMEIDPAEGFAPLKNAPGAVADTPEAVRTAMVAQHRRWLEAAGAEVADGVDVEIGPLWAINADEVAEKASPGTRVVEETYYCC